MKDVELYQYGDYKVGESRTLYFPEVHGKQEKGITPKKGWEPGKYISVCNNHIDKVKIARFQILVWHSLNKFCDILVTEVYE